MAGAIRASDARPFNAELSLRPQPRISTWPLSIGLCVALVGFLLFVGGLCLILSGPTKPDRHHPMYWTSRGVNYYCRPVVYYTPWVGIGLLGASALFNLLAFQGIAEKARKAGVPEGKLLSKIRLFGEVDL